MFLKYKTLRFFNNILCIIVMRISYIVQGSYPETPRDSRVPLHWTKATGQLDWEVLRLQFGAEAGPLSLVLMKLLEIIG